MVKTIVAIHKSEAFEFTRDQGGRLVVEVPLFTTGLEYIQTVLVVIFSPGF